MDFVDEQHLLLAQVGEHSGQVAFDLQRRARGLLKRRAQFVGDDVGQRRLAQPRRPVEQHVIERLAARLGRLDGDLEVVLDLVLPDEFAQPLRPQLEFKRRVVIDRRGRHNALAIQAVLGKNHDGAMVKRKGRLKQ